MSIKTAKVQVKANPAFSFLTDYDNRFEVVYGGAGSGKSYAVQQNIIIGCMQYPERKYLCIRKVANTLRHSVFALFNHIIFTMGLRDFFTSNKTDMSYQCVTGAEIVLLGLDDVEKLKSIYGVTDIWVEEANEISENDMKQLNLRLRGGDQDKRIILTFNPILQTHWLKQYFFDLPKENAGIHKTTYKDNWFLDDEYKQELENLKNIDPYFYQVYTLGEWGQLGNTVFSNYTIHNFDYTEQDFKNVSNGIDFGFNHPSALVRAGFRDGELYIFDEFYQKNLTNTELIEAAKEFDGDYRRHRYTADSAEPDRIKEFKQSGFLVKPAKKGKDSVRHGVDFLRRYKIHIHASRCPNTARQIQTFKYKEDKDGNILDEFVEYDDDCIAALRYAIEDLRLHQRAARLSNVSLRELGL